MKLKTLLDRCNISVTAFAALVGVARPTASNWLNGHREVSRHVFPQFSIVTARLKAALELRKLPLDRARPAGVNELDQLRKLLR